MTDYSYTEFYITAEMLISILIANKIECLEYAAFLVMKQYLDGEGGFFWYCGLHSELVKLRELGETHAW